MLDRHPVDTSAHGFVRCWNHSIMTVCIGDKLLGPVGAGDFFGRSAGDLEGCNFIGLQIFPFENITILIVYISCRSCGSHADRFEKGHFKILPGMTFFCICN